MAEFWEPTEDHDSYGDDMGYIERRFGLRPISELFSQTDVIGVARIAIMPSFSPESIYTLTYHSATICVEAANAKYSLWSSLNGGKWEALTIKRIDFPLDNVPYPLNSWLDLKAVANTAPTVRVAIIEGREMVCRDGVSVRHHLVDGQTNLFAKWHNPTELASNHISQMILLNAYNDIFTSCGGPDYFE